MAEYSEVDGPGDEPWQYESPDEGDFDAPPVDRERVGGYDDTGIVRDEQEYADTVVDTPELLDQSSLATWDQAEPLGKVPGSEWVNPVQGWRALDDVRKERGAVTNEDILAGGGRQQHLEMHQLPEGYAYVDIVDSTTGEALRGYDDMQRFAGEGKCEGGTIDSAAFIRNAVAEPIDIGGGKEIRRVINLKHGTQNLILPAYTRNPDYASGGYPSAVVSITPAGREVYMEAIAPIAALEAGIGTMKIHQLGKAIASKLIIYQDIPDVRNKVQVGMQFGTDGQISAMQVQKSWLKEVGMQEEGFDFLSNGANVTDPRLRQKVAESLGEVLGMDGWNGIDVRRTAASLYMGIGQRDLDVTTALFPKQ